jgi:hypothetical protein
VTPDISSPVIASWAQSDTRPGHEAENTLRDPKEITLGGGFTQAQVDAAVKAATDPLNARIAGIKAKVAAGAVDVADD